MDKELNGLPRWTKLIAPVLAVAAYLVVLARGNGPAESLIAPALVVAIYVVLDVFVGASNVVEKLVRDPKAERKQGRHGDALLDNLTSLLRHRASLLRATARFALVLIVVSLGGGTWVFVQADTLAAQSASRGWEGRLVDEVVSNVVSGERITISGDMTELAQAELAREVVRAINKADLGRALEHLEAQIPGADTSGIRIASALSTRVATALLLLFLVQIMVTLYRYGTRVAAYYDARADALQISTALDDVRAFGALCEVLSPDQIDFGKIPESSLDKVVDKAAKAAD